MLVADVVASEYRGPRASASEVSATDSPRVGACDKFILSAVRFRFIPAYSVHQRWADPEHLNPRSPCRCVLPGLISGRSQLIFVSGSGVG